jgi:sulfate transport system substrate-binding protein
MKINRHGGLALLALLVLGLVAACGGDDEGGDDSSAASSAAPAGDTTAAAGESSAAAPAGEGGKLTLVAYSTPKEAYEAVIPAFQKTPAGAGVTFDQSYGASGDQSRAIVSGLPADIGAFSLEPDMTRLVDEGLVDADWNAGPNKGMVTDSVVVFLVRKGNPKAIKTWDDLIKPGVEVINPNPFVSGGARWNVMAGYGAQIEQGKTEEQAVEYLEKLFRQIVVQPKSAREGLNAFVEGKGDVLIAYENEAITAQQKGEDVDYVIPDETILIENPIGVVNTSKSLPAAKAFVDFAISPDGQRLFAKAGYRPVDQAVLGEFTDTFPTPAALFTIQDVGGWPDVMKTFFDKDDGIVAKINRDLGVPLEG